MIELVITMLRENIAPLALSQVHARLTGESRFKGVSARGFLRAIEPVESLLIDLEKPDIPTIALASADAAIVAQRVLADSDRALPIEAILKLAKQKFGAVAAGLPLSALNKAAYRDANILRLGQRALGVSRHIRLPAGAWNQLRSDVLALVIKERRPLSCRVILQNFPHWGRQYELSYILQHERLAPLIPSWWPSWMSIPYKHE